VFQGLVLGKFDALYFANLVAFVIALVLISVASILVYYKMQKQKAKFRDSVLSMIDLLKMKQNELKQKEKDHD
jgi:hypothetical protein